MSTISKFVSGTSLSEKNIPVPGKYAGESMLIENVLDFSTSGPGKVLAADVVKALKVPANCLVEKVGVFVITGEGATCTATVGDTAGANSWDASANLETAATSNVSLSGTDAYALGKVYTAESSIDLVMGHDTDTAKICVWAVIHMFGTDLVA